ncbi:hypothetical protein B0O99DRAFT_583890 [Bisporella sp. PMI_857]|nr:hypothetical protein B0O99DRAFT_583890 [Bisporella sp. PMI_857]
MYGTRDDKKTAQVNNTSETAEDNHPHIEDGKKNHGHLFWVEISWRFALGLVFSAIITVILYTFSQKGKLSRWEKRWFNVLTILFSSLVSLMLGSLLGVLGSMLRWQLLARKLHKPMDVDLILGISNPTGAFRLIWYHAIKDRKWTATTVIVTFYLLLNVIGRLSVAAFGLTFDLNELPGIEYPVKLTDWSTPAWFNVSATSYDLLSQSSRRMSDYASVGLSTAPSEFDSKNPANFTLTNSAGQGLDRKVEGDKVTYSYSLKEYQGVDVRPAQNKVLHSSSSCVGRTLWGSNVFAGGKLVGNLSNRPTLYTFMTDQSSQGLYSEDWLSYQSQYDRNATFFECNTCLTDTSNNPGLGANILFNQAPDISPLVAGHLLRFGAFERVFGGYDTKGSQLAIRLYSGMNKNSHFLNDMENALHTGATKDAPRVEVPAEAELYAAHLAARLPLLAIIGADIQLPKVTREQGASELPFISVVLEVKWARTIAVLVSILVGQLLAIVAVKVMCRNVFLRDHDSFFSVARLMKTAMGEVKGRSTSKGKEISGFLEGKGKLLKYGTRARGDCLEVDLWEDTQSRFPPAYYL